MNGADLSELSMRELFRMEAQGQTQVLTTGLLALEQNPRRPDQLEECMRAAHSLKGAARIVDVGPGVVVAHAMEELFVAAQEGRTVLSRAQIDVLLEGVDLIGRIAEAPEGATGEPDPLAKEAAAYVGVLGRVIDEPAAAQTRDPAVAPAAAPVLESEPAIDSAAPGPAGQPGASGASGRAMRVSADNLNRLLDLAGESLVESRRLKPLGQALHRLKRLQRGAAQSIDVLRDLLGTDAAAAEVRDALTAAERSILECRQHLGERIAELEAADYQATALAHRLYDQALMVRMRPFSDGTAAYPRMVRDVAHSLGKAVRLEFAGLSTQVDRDILERLDAPLGHLLRNAIDHGIEPPHERLAAGKPEEAVVTVSAHHSSGTLQIQVSDDGRGIDPERIRSAVVARKLATEDVAARLSEAELLEFLFLPGFTMKGEVTHISGRGVGLDAVHAMVKKVGGRVQIVSRPGEGTRFQLQLPLTLSVIRALLVEIGGEPYAFSYAQVLRAIKVQRSALGVVEGRQHFDLEGKQVALVGAHQILARGSPPQDGEDVAVVVIGSHQSMYGVAVDCLVGGRELVVQPLDPRLGKIKDVSAGALMEDGSPLLILDAEDMVRSIEKLASSDRLGRVGEIAGETAAARPVKRILVVDDSFTVRELQRKLLDHQGYEVEVAVDGADGWNAVRNSRFDLVVTDVDMPRMDGIQLVGLIKRDPGLSALPVMIVSYKDREADRRRGLDAGADYYLTKGSYQNDALIDAVIDLIGEAQA